ncbi:VIR protein [Plasmodium vivax]|uniref:VIR protein n=1 Tax=Plasmodium vivax TaxID=5855 RepID=A0A1G4E958_PLAVI|nr:VIR protein [Plasmodium vivax]
MDKSLKDGVYEYMNFWLNHELNLNNKNASALIEKYNETLKTVNEGAYKFQKLVGKLNYIDKTNLAGMKLLNELYTYYYEINDIPSKGASHENRLCSEKSQILANKYNIARNMCIDSNYGLYSALMEFKNNYEDVYEEVLNTGKCNSAHLIKLPSEYDILKISVNGLHKFTPLGTCVFVKERKKKKKFDIRDDNMQEMLQDAYHNGTRSANRKRLNILYNAS